MLLNTREIFKKYCHGGGRFGGIVCGRMVVAFAENWAWRVGECGAFCWDFVPVSWE